MCLSSGAVTDAQFSQGSTQDLFLAETSGNARHKAGRCARRGSAISSSLDTRTFRRPSVVKDGRRGASAQHGRRLGHGNSCSRPTRNGAASRSHVLKLSTSKVGRLELESHSGHRGGPCSSRTLACAQSLAVHTTGGARYVSGGVARANARRSRRCAMGSTCTWCSRPRARATIWPTSR